MIKAKEFRELTLANQEEEVSKAIEDATSTANPMICFNFVFYKEISQRLKKLGWDVYDDTNDQDDVVGQMICPRGFFESPDEDEDEDDED